MSELLRKTKRKEDKLIELGYNVISKWECDFEVPEGLEINNIIKQNHVYKMISNGRFSFKDIVAYITPGKSLEEYLKAFDTLVPKGRFCHKMTQNLSEFLEENPRLLQYKDNVIELLKHSPIPECKWFYNDLKEEPIDTELYNSITHKYSNVYDLLKDYNNQDVAPAIEATKKLAQFFKDRHLDVHKDGISISGLTLKYLWQMKDKDSEFELFKGNEELYYKYRNGLVGGPSIVFNHYQEKDKTRIRGGKLCKSIQGVDANALYLWALDQEMLVGKHNIVEYYPELIKDIIEDTFYGVVECDIEVPEDLKDYFSEFQPIFKNVEVEYKVLSQETKQQVSEGYKSRKLIGSFFGKKMLFHSELLKWYLKKGLVVSNITLAVQYEKKAPFKKFVKQISDARRKGDISDEYKLIGEMSKLLGNSAVGKTITNFMKHEKVSIVSDSKFVKNIKSSAYRYHEDLHEGFEFRFKKLKHKQDLPLQIGFAVYQLAKLKMLQYYYDFLDVYVDRSDFQLCQMDTDSMYASYSKENLEDLIKPELKEQFQAEKHEWFGREDNVANKLYDKRTPGLFKVEYQGTGIIALASKMYYCFNDEYDKFSSKGINHRQNELTKDRYKRALEGDSSQIFINKGFRVLDNKMNTYSIEKTGMRLFNDKRKRIGFETIPTNA